MSELGRAFPGPPELVRLRAVGRPAPKGSKKAFVIPPRGPGQKPRAQVVDDNSRSLKDWTAAVARAAEEAMAALGHPPVMAGPLSVRAVFYLPAPASLSPRWRWLPTTKPDLDKLERATWDAMTGIVYRDDAQIVDGARRKLYAIERTPGCVVEVRSLAAHEETTGRAWRAGGPRPRLP